MNFSIKKWTHESLSNQQYRLRFGLQSSACTKHDELKQNLSKSENTATLAGYS